MKRYLFPIILSLLSVCVHAQKRDITVKEYFADAEFFFVEEEYIDALQDYLEVYKRGYQENANINYRIGICYLNIPGQKDKAVNFLIKATQGASTKYIASTLNEEQAPLDAYIYLGNAYRVLYQFDKALESYNKYLELIPEVELEEKNYARKQIENVQIASEFVDAPVTVAFTNLGKIINTSSSNHNCVISADSSTMAFMSKLPFYEAVYITKRRENGWSQPINITPQIMSDGDQFVTGISSDGTKLLLTKEGVFDSDIYQSVFENGQWTKSEPIGKPINTRFWESHASFADNDKSIYFTSNKREGFGGVDIYVSKLQVDGLWSEPKNLGKNINTKYNEDSPFVTSDGQKLYFSSQGHMNMGGYDFFVSELSDSGWSSPENLKYPISTSDEDIFYFPFKNGEIGYVSKIYDDGFGSWDIHLVEFPEFDVVDEIIAEQISEDVEEEQEIQVEEVELETKLEFVVSPILFGFDNSTLTADARLEISKYMSLLNNYSSLKLKIIGHTDALGPEHYNQKLSEKRAVSIFNYFKDKGIPSNRMEIVGMGERQFVAINKNPDGSDSPEGRKYNRRVDFELYGEEMDKLFLQKKNIVPEAYRIKEE